MTEKELCKFGIKDDSECLYCGEQESIEHTFSDCYFTKGFLSKVVQWFKNCNQSTFMLSDQEYLFGVSSNLTSKKLMKKINFILPYARYFIYTNKLHDNSILMRDFVRKISTKFILEKLD